MVTIGELAEVIPDSEVMGDKDHMVERVVHHTALKSQHDLFLVGTEQLVERISAVGAPRACAIIDRVVWQSVGDMLADRLSALIVSPRPRFALARIGAVLSRTAPASAGVHPSANIDPSAEIGDGCAIGAGVWIAENVLLGAGVVIDANVSIGAGTSIGERCRIHSGVVIADGIIIGNRVIVQPNAILGGDGFAFETERRNVAEKAKRGDAALGGDAQRWERIESFGTVVIGDDVEIGAGAAIDRATFGETVIERGCKIDNLVQIGHNCRIGEDTLICSQVGLAGSTTVGNGCILAGKVGVADHLVIGDSAVVMAKSGVTRNLDGGAVYYGMPARPVKETLRGYAHITRLGDLRQRLAALERELQRLTR